MSTSTLPSCLVLLVFALSGVLPAADPPKDAKRFLGKIEPVAIVTIQARVSGVLTELNVKEGSLVKQGDLIAKIDPRQYEAGVKVAQAQLALEQAQLKAAEAELTRTSILFKRGVSSMEELNRAEALAEKAKAAVFLAQATAHTAEIVLSYTQLSSPIAGRVGRIEVTPGNLVGAEGPTKLTTVIATDPLFVIFQVDEAAFLQLRKKGLDVKDRIPVTITATGDSTLSGIGVIDSLASNLEADGTIVVRAVVANPKGDWIPGLSVEVQLGEK